MARRLNSFPFRTGGVALFACVLAGPADAQPPVGDPIPAVRFQIDKDRRIFAGIKDDDYLQSETQNLDEFLSYNEVFEFAQGFRTDELEANARRDVAYKDLMGKTREEYKLDLILLEGRLWRLVKREPTPTLAAAGVRAIYEGWLFPKNTSEPVCVVFSELPAGLTPALRLEPPPTVRFAGYAFKVIRYESHDIDPADPAHGKMRRAPLLIGRSVTVVPKSDSGSGSAWQETFVPAILLGLGAISAAGFALAWWFRRGDRAVRATVAGRVQQNPFVAV